MSLLRRVGIGALVILLSGAAWVLDRSGMPNRPVPPFVVRLIDRFMALVHPSFRGVIMQKPSAPTWRRTETVLWLVDGDEFIATIDCPRKNRRNPPYLIQAQVRTPMSSPLPPSPSLAHAVAALRLRLGDARVPDVPAELAGVL